MSSQRRASLVLLVAVVMGILATPGLDFMPKGALQTKASTAVVESRLGPLGVEVARGVVAFNRNVRLPMVKLLEPVQKPFRVAQTWNLYRDGPRRVRRMEIQVDGAPVYRTGSDTLDWAQVELANRKLRPVLETTARGRSSRNWRGRSRYIVEKARGDFPDAQQISLLFLVGDFPGVRMEESHRIEAAAPLWIVRMR